jgi:glycosyltransferase involved in cell wall biosynthesis
LFTIHGHDFNFSYLSKKINRHVLKYSDLTIFVSKTQRDYFLKKYRLEHEKTTVLYNGIDFTKFDNYQHKSLREEFKIPPGSLLLGSVGNFNQGRDQLSICRFLRLLNETDINFTFIFAGSQSSSAPWFWDNCQKFVQENKLSEKVIFAGPRYDVPNFNSQLDAFIYSTEHDTFGIAIIEAMLMGVPVFINDWKVFFEITDSGKHANLFKSKDESSLLECFIDFLNNRENYIQKAKQGAEWVRKKYSIQTHTSNLLHIYKEMHSR